MKTIKLKYLAFILIASIMEAMKILLFIILFPSKYIFKGSHWGYSFLDKYQRLLIENAQKLNLKKKKVKPVTAKKKVKNKPISQNTDIMGKTKTEFLKEFTEEPIKPFLSQDLEKESVVEEEPDINPDDVDYRIDQVALEEFLEDNELTDSHDGDIPSGEFSTGATIEELSEAYDSLTKDSVSDEEAQKAVNVLNIIEGTDFFHFITMNEALSEKARLLLEKAGIQMGLLKGGNTRFDFSRYMD